MSRRGLLSLVSLAVVGLALAVWFWAPRYSTYIVYLLFVWIVVSFTLNWTSGPAARPRGVAVASASTPSPAPASAGTQRTVPAPALVLPSDSAEIPFCIYCGTHLPSGTARCPACGHAEPMFA
ncbi:MAG TPA: hypothetical protein VMH49_03325 [Thermoplasmata archaeon]|nr:hypothetical protein [Thermoplasmata archaeon]